MGLSGWVLAAPSTVLPVALGGAAGPLAAGHLGLPNLPFASLQSIKDYMFPVGSGEHQELSSVYDSSTGAEPSLLVAPEQSCLGLLARVCPRAVPRTAGNLMGLMSSFLF